VTAVAADLIHYRPLVYTIEIDRRTTQTSALVLALANSPQWGFGACIAPSADIEDGALDLVVVQSRRTLGNLLRVPSLFTRRIDRQAGVQTRRVREVTIRSPEAMLFHVDGEAVQGTDMVVARVRPGALKLQA
jgi:diacylglycerol kinase family enzyme